MERTEEQAVRIEQLHNSLDELALESLDLIESLLEERKTFDRSLSDGFLEIARSRHVMGSRSVGALQLPVDGGRSVEASAKVDRTATREYLFGRVSFTVAKLAVIDAKEVLEGPDGGIGPEGLRKRGIAGIKEERGSRGPQDGESTSPDESLPPKKIERISSRKDPLNWFGVLVPRSLRDGQRYFRDSLNLVCRIATLQTNLEIVRNKFRELNDELERLKSKI